MGGTGDVIAMDMIKMSQQWAGGEKPVKQRGREELAEGGEIQI